MYPPPLLRFHLTLVLLRLVSLLVRSPRERFVGTLALITPLRMIMMLSVARRRLYPQALTASASFSCPNAWRSFLANRFMAL